MQFKETYKTLFASLLPQLVSDIIESSLQNSNLTIPLPEKDLAMEELILMENQKIMGFLEEAVLKSGKFEAILSGFEENLQKFIDLKHSESKREEIDKENAALVEEAISRAISQKANSPAHNSLQPPRNIHERANSTASTGSNARDSTPGTPEKLGREVSKKDQPRKSSGFGFKNMLSSLTKSRPSKPGRSSKTKGVNEEKSIDGEPATGDSGADIVGERPHSVVLNGDVVNEEAYAEEVVTKPVDTASSPTPELEERASEVQAKKFVPTNAMAAMALAMKSGLSSSSLEKAAEANQNNDTEPSPIHSQPASASSAQTPIISLAEEPLQISRTASPPVNIAPLPPPRSRPVSVATDEHPASPVQKVVRLPSEPVLAQNSDTVPPLPASRPRPTTTFDLQNSDAPPRTAATKPRPATWFDAPIAGASATSGDIRNSMRPMVLPRPASSYNNTTLRQASSQPHLPDAPVDLNSIDTGEDVFLPFNVESPTCQNQRGGS
jgi:hypothetical protein